MKICIVANNAYGALTGEESGHIGGVERQTALLTEWLMARGHQVSIITWNEGGEEPVEYINDIKIIKLCKVSDGLPILRFFIPRWSSLITALKKADAEVYYHNCAEYVTGQVALWCKQNNKPFIYTVASDADCDIKLPNLKSKREEYLFKYGLTHASLVITQTKAQQVLLQNNYGISAEVINMPGTPPRQTPSFNRNNLFNNKKVIWVGRLHKVKRIEWLIDIANKMPDILFEVIGPIDDKSDYINEILPRLTKANNINYKGKISRLDMPDIYQNATILCCTSIYEGFPNTYLEAWSYGVPVITTIDPDNIIKDKQLGFHVTEKDNFPEHIKKIMQDKEKWQLASFNSQKYYLENHDQEHVMKKFENVFQNISSYKVKNHFNQQSDIWSNYYKNHAVTISHLDLQHRLIHCQNMLARISLIQVTPRLLDIGCGSGDSFSAIKTSGNWRIEGIDISNKMVKEANLAYPDINAQVANAIALPFSDRTFQVVVSLGVLEYIPEYKQAIREASRVLSPQGSLIISIPNKQSIFRQLRRLESMITIPLKNLISRKKNKQKNEKIFHRQWHQKAFIDVLQQQQFYIENIEYCTYALLSPKLEEATANIKMCQWLNKKLSNKLVLNKFLANTIIIHARVINS